MAEAVRAVTWEAPEHHHIEKSSDWFWALGVLAIAGGGAAILFDNTLFGVLIILGAAVMMAVALREPDILPYAVTTRGVRVGNDLYPYSTLESFYIDDEHGLGPQLLVKSQHMLMPLIILPIPEEYVDEIDDLIGARLAEEHMEEPFAHKLMEFFGF
jgi:hypothetical protein